MSFHEEAFKMLRQDLDMLDAYHARGCPLCSPEHLCGYAGGIRAAYEKVEQRLSLTKHEFPTVRAQAQSVRDDKS